MTPERWKQVEEVFQGALDRPHEERQTFIAEKCGEDDSLRRQVEALVAQYEAAGDFIEAPAYAGNFTPGSTPFKTAHLDNFADDPADDPMAGARIGAYKIVREIGRGGMGAVYLAVRADSEYQKRVAIKLVKRGMDTDFILRRFRNERQILASLDHPNIARLLDGGTTADGLPYFVMEYIEGQPLYRYCDGEKLTIHERLRLFTNICNAVAYAHQNLVVHRDIKPSNILICSDGTPKLLDFGIAKLLNPELTPDTITPTATAMRLMTPEYASPEQVRGEPATPASDIYSLGILLYELLTGHRPYHFSNRAPHEIARVICEEEPEHPSRVVTRSEDILPLDLAAGGEATTLEFLCKMRGGTLESVRRELTGDLDNITLKALRKEPGRRYASVERLRDDIVRHLEGRPVSAPFFFPSAVKTSRPLSGDPQTGEKSVAVLPLRLLHQQRPDETGDNYLGIGLADALITRLSKLRRFSVRPTSSVMRYGDGHADPFAAGHELGVSFVVDGRIQRAGDRIRITIQLLNVYDGATVWAEQFDEKYTDVLSLEDAISAQVAQALVPQLTGDEREKLAKRGTDNAEAFEAYLRGRYHWNTFHEDGFAKAITCYYRAITLDPDYAAAYTGVADYYNWIGIYGVMPPAECSAAAKEAGAKALELDETLPDAHIAYGFALHTHDLDWNSAAAHFRRGMELNPHHALAHLWHGTLLTMQGDFDAGLLSARRALELDPLTLFNQHMYGWSLFYARRYEESIVEYRKLTSAASLHGLGYFGYSWSLAQLGRHEEAIDAATKAIELSGPSPFMTATLASAYAGAGRTKEARGVLDELEELAVRRYVSPYHLALAYCQLGERERAFALLEQSFADREAWVVWLGVQPQFDPLRSDPRFAKLLHRTKNPASTRLAGEAAVDVAEKSNIHNSLAPTLEFPADPGEARAARPQMPARESRLALRAVIAALIALVVITGTFFFLKRSAQPLAAAGANPWRLTTDIAIDWHPDYSPDGKRIAFASNRDGANEIYVMNLDGSAVRRLTYNTSEDDCPAWSPDGKKIAFQSRRDRQMEIYVMDADGSNQINLSNNPAEDTRPSWSPDGTQIVYGSNTLDLPQNFEIYTMRADGSGKTRLTDNPNFDNDPSWSPDGQRIAFASDRDGKSYEIYVMNADGSDVRNLTNHPGNDVKPAWSPDGKRIAFAGNRPNKTDYPAIYVMDADGSNQRLLTEARTFDDEPTWSSDSQRVAFQTQRDGNFEIYLADAFPQTDAAQRGGKKLRSVAVLPFTTVGAQGDEQYLGVGIADELTKKLGELDEITLRTPAAVRRYLGTDKSRVEAGRELKVDYVLSGWVERVGDRVLTALELTEVASGRILWAEKFNERFTDIASLQSSISQRIARALSLELTSDEQRRLNKHYTDNSEAQQLYLAGRYHWGKRTPEGLRQAIANFQQAIAKDSRFALAYAGLADCYALLNWYLEPPPADAFARARQAAERAVELDDTLAEAHVSLAFARFHYDRDWTGAASQFQRAINLNPNYPTAHHWYSFNLSAMERHDESIAEMKRAEELDPRSPVIAAAVANVLFHARRYDETIEQCRKALELDPGSVAAHVVLRWAYEKKGMHEAAFAIYEKERAFAGDTPTTRAKLAHVLAVSGREREARPILEELVARRKQQWVTAYEIAVVYALLGDKDNAFNWLAKAEKEHAVGYTYLRVDPHLDNLRGDPRYAGLLR